MGKYLPSGNFISMMPEFDGFRNATTALPVTQLVALDICESSFEILEPYRNRDEVRSIGSGRNIHRIVELGYTAGEGSLEQKLVSGVMLGYALGDVSSVGTTISGSVTETITTVSGNDLVIDGTPTYATNVFAGKSIEVTTGACIGEQYYVLSNTTDTLTVYPTPPATITNNVIAFKEGPYTHVITESDDLRSFALHTHQQDSSATNVIARDLLGVIIKNHNGKIEAGEGTVCKQTNDVVVSKSIAGATSGTLPTDSIVGAYTWDHLVKNTATEPCSYLRYYSTATIANEVIGNTTWTDGSEFSFIDSIEYTIDNSDSEVTKVMGDEFPALKKIGKRDYSLKMHVYPQSDLLYRLRNTKVEQYTGNLECKLTLLRTVTDYISVRWNSLYVSAYPNKLITIEDKLLGVDIELKNAPLTSNTSAGVCNATVVDNLCGIRFYGG